MMAVKKRERMKTVSFRITPEQYSALKRVSAETEASSSDVARTALEHFLSQDRLQNANTHEDPKSA